MADIKNTQYRIENIHINERFPGKIYAEIHNKEEVVVKATLDYCNLWIKYNKEELSVDFYKQYNAALYDFLGSLIVN